MKHWVELGSIFEPITGQREKIDSARKQEKAQLKMQADAEADMEEKRKVNELDKQNKKVRARANAQSVNQSQTVLGTMNQSGGKTLLGQ